MLSDVGATLSDVGAALSDVDALVGGAGIDGGTEAVGSVAAAASRSSGAGGGVTGTGAAVDQFVAGSTSSSYHGEVVPSASVFIEDSSVAVAIFRR